MLQSQILMLSVIGFIAMLIALYSASNEFVIITGLIGTFAFGLATFGLFSVEVVSNGTVVQVGEYPPLALFTLALALTSFWPALTGPVDLIGSAVTEDDPFRSGGV